MTHLLILIVILVTTPLCAAEYTVAETDEEIRIIVGDVLEPATENTVRTLDSLLEKIASVRESGIAMEEGETVNGVTTLAIAIDTILGRYSVSVLFPTARRAAKESQIREALLECKHALIGEIGKLDETQVSGGK